MDYMVEVTLAIFLAGVIFQSGRLTVRVDTLEAFVDELRERMQRMERKIDGIAAHERRRDA